MRVSPSAAVPRKYFGAGRGKLLVAIALLAAPGLASAAPSPSLPPSVRGAIVRAGEDALNHGPFTLVNKQRLAPGGDPHDYLSIGPYWWPNPTTEDGLPYVRRDGEWNPSNDADREALSAFVATVRRLALAFHTTGNERYAEHACGLVRTWFLDPSTKMNPHLRHAQAIPGINEGRPAGIIDTWELPDVIGGIRFLRSSQSWSSQDEAGLKVWFSEFLDWLLQSNLGQAEAAEKNNHGSWFLAQVTAYAAFCGRPETVRPFLQSQASALLQSQIAEDGSQPLEVSRTRSLHYSIFNLTAWMDIAELSTGLGSDFLSAGTPEAASLHRAVRYLGRHGSGSAVWPHPEKEPESPEKLRPLLLRAAAFFHDTSLREAADRLPQALDIRSLFNLTEAGVLDSAIL